MHLQKGFLPVQIALMVALAVAGGAIGYKTITTSTEFRSKASGLYPTGSAELCLDSCNKLGEGKYKTSCIAGCAKTYNLIKATPTSTPTNTPTPTPKQKLFMGPMPTSTPTPTPKPSDCRTMGCPYGTTCQCLSFGSIFLGQCKCKAQ